MTTGAPTGTSAERLSASVAKLTRGLLRQGREEARTLGLTLPQLFLLAGLREMGRIPVTRWAELTGASPSATTALLDGLEAAGYLVRSHDAADRRQVLVSLTPRGRAQARRLADQYRAKWRTWCEAIPSTQLDAASATLERIIARFSPPSTHRSATPVVRLAGVPRA